MIRGAEIAIRSAAIAFRSSGIGVRHPTIGIDDRPNAIGIQSIGTAEPGTAFVCRMRGSRDSRNAISGAPSEFHGRCGAIGTALGGIRSAAEAILGRKNAIVGVAKAIGHRKNASGGPAIANGGSETVVRR